MTLLASPPDPRKCFEKRWAYQAMEAAIRRGDNTQIHRGGRGCAKTLSLCHIFHEFALMYPGLRQVWMRWERSKMTETVLQTFEDEVLGIGHPLRSGPAREGRRGYEYPNGSRIILMGISDDVDATKSLQADIIWVNECGQVPYSVWDEIGSAARERIGLSPSGFNQLKIGDLNPMPPSHWTNAMAAEFPEHIYPRVHDNGESFAAAFTPEMYAEAQRYNLAPWDRTQHKHKLIQWFPPDNPGYWDFQTWDWHPAGLKYVRDRLGMLGTNLKARYLEGRPVAVEGVVFPEFSRERHVIRVGPGALFPNGWPSDWPVWLAYDPGYSHPCGVLYWGVAPDETEFIVDEIHGSGMDIDEVARRLKEKAPKYRIVAWLDDPKGANQKTQIAHGKTVRQYMAEQHALYFRPWRATAGPAKQSSVEQFRVKLTRKNPIQVFHTCKGFISNMESWKNKTNAQGELVAGDDAYEDRDNDLIDGALGIQDEQPKYTPGVFSFDSNRE